ADPDEGQGEAHLEAPPSISHKRIQDEDAREDLEREEVQEVHGPEAEELLFRTEEDERTDRVRAPPGERPPDLLRERLWEDEEPVRRAREGHHRRGPERESRAEEPQDAAECGPDDEADAPRRADHPERHRA